MKRSIISFCFFLLIQNIFGQLYTGSPAENKQKYSYTLRIQQDSAIHLVYNRDDNGIYAYYKGRIKRINDTLFHISATLDIGLFPMKAFDLDTIYIRLDSAVARQLDVIEIRYANGTILKQLQGYDRKGRPIDMLEIPFNKSLFNRTKGSDYIKIGINRKIPFTDQWLSFKISYGSAASIRRGGTEEIDLVYKNDVFTSTGEQYNHFKLRKKKE